MKIIDFKSIDPFFSWERDGIKPFTTRQRDSKDPRFKSLLRFKWSSVNNPWGMRIINPATGESFVRRIISWDRLTDHYLKSDPPEWWIIYLGRKMEEVKHE